MANLTIKTDLGNTTDSQNTITSVVLDGVPFKPLIVVSSRTFTVNSGFVFDTKPFIDLAGVSDKNAYIVTKTQTVSSTTFTVKYNRPLSPPTTDVLLFFASTKPSAINDGTKIHSVNVDESLVTGIGTNRTVVVTGDVGAKFVIDILKWPKLSPESLSSTVIAGPLTETIPIGGVYSRTVRIPTTTEITDYKFSVKEVVANTFHRSIASPFAKYITQYPLQETRLVISDGGLGTARTPSTIYFSASYGGVSSVPFTCTVTKNSTDFIAGQVDPVQTAFTGTTMRLDTNYATKKAAVGDFISGTSIPVETRIVAVNVGGVNDTYTISAPPTAEVEVDAVISIDTFTPYRSETGGYDDYVVVNGVSATVKNNLILDTVEPTIIAVNSNSITIDNSASAGSAVVKGNLDINHGYDGHGGHTTVTLDINDILRS